MTNEPGSRRDAGAHRRATLVMSALILIGAAVVGLTYEWMHQESRSPLTLVTVSTPSVDAGVDAGETIALPTGDPTAQLHQAAAGLSRRPEWERWLDEPHAISRLVAAAYRIAEGENVPPLLLFFAPDRDFTVDSHEGKLFLGHETIADRTTITDVVTSISAEKAAEAYARLAPYGEAAFREIAHPGENLTSVLHQAIHELRGAPVPDKDPALVRNGTAYFFEDAQLQKLPPAQKQLLRMGNSNAHRIQQWLAALDRALPP